MIIHNLMGSPVTIGGVVIQPHQAEFVADWEKLKQGKVFGKLVQRGLLVEEEPVTDHEIEQAFLEAQSSEELERYEAGYP